MLQVIRRGGLNCGPSTYRVFPFPMESERLSVRAGAYSTVGILLPILSAPCLPSQKHPVKGCYQKSTRHPLAGSACARGREPASLLDCAASRCDNNLTMKIQRQSPLTDTLKDAIIRSGIPYKTLERETGVQRSSIQRFIDGRQWIRLDVADRLASYFGLRLSIESRNDSDRLR